jgi:hypothetical protein
VETWVEAQKTILYATETTDLNLASRISTENDDVPIIETNEKDSITNNYLNLDTNEIKSNKEYLQEKLKEFKQLHPPIIMPISEKPYALINIIMARVTCRKRSGTTLSYSLSSSRFLSL